MVDLSSLTLFVGTPAQAVESQKRTWPQWGGTLTEEQYLERYRRMDAQDHAADSRMITWVLAPRDDPETLDYMCSCETYKRTGLVRYTGSNELKEVSCYGVACVFTPPSKRGNGYASQMMRLLHWVISSRTPEYNLPPFPAEWGAPPPEAPIAGNAFFCNLYSDLGPNFYNQTGPGLAKEAGWEVRGSISTLWDFPLEAEAQQNGSQTEWTSYTYEELPTLWEKDAQLIRRTLANLPETSPDYLVERPKVFVAYLPDKGVGSFVSFRSAFATDDIIKMDVYAIEKKNGNPDQPTYAAWHVDVRPLPATLIITRIVSTESEFPELIGKIKEIARKSGVGRVDIWNIPKHLYQVAEKTGGKTFNRMEHMTSLKWYGEGKTADVEWVVNQKFCWC